MGHVSFFLLRRPTSWSSPPFVILGDIHYGLLANYDCKDSAPPQSQPDTRDRLGRSSQDRDSHQQETGPLFIPHLPRLHESFHVRGEDDSNMTTIPTQKRLTLQILNHWRPFQVFQQTFSVSHRSEHLLLRKQEHVTTEEDSVLRTELGD